MISLKGKEVYEVITTAIIIALCFVLLLYTWCDSAMFKFLNVFVGLSLVMYWIGLSGQTIAMTWVILFCLKLLFSIVYFEDVGEKQ